MTNFKLILLFLHIQMKKQFTNVAKGMQVHEKRLLVLFFWKNKITRIESVISFHQKDLLQGEYVIEKQFSAKR